MAYIKKIIGSDETLLDIARLHWIYLLTGIAWFIGCTLAGWLVNLGIYKFMTAMFAAFESSSGMLPLIALNNWLMPVAMITGITIFCFYLIKVLTTEIGLTNRRVLHKSGWLFVKTRQIDIEEVRGEFLDLGFWGRFLHYGFLNLDCRFIGDVRLPAIEEPEKFVKILHKVRSDIMDTVTLVAGKGNPVIVKTESSQEDDDDIRTPEPAPKPAEQAPALALPPEPTPPKAGDVVMTEDGRFVAAPGGNPFMVAQTQPGLPTPGQPDQPPAQPEVSPPSQPQQPMPGPEIQPPTQPTPPPTQPTGAAATVDPATVAQIVEQVMPKMVEKITAEMAAKGITAQPELPKHDHDPDGIHVDADLISSFDDAISKRKNGPGLRIVH